ncbi:class I SAM-dependent methyltransferase [Pseudoalteromonas fuliginea]|uniref:class I SAM-dependent methyltransferase n=1 Tax=Pseudoalteromonas fuliginea TaxID=1872678 RepID=UPI0031771D3B
MLELSGPENYSENWAGESDLLEKNNTYEKLAKLAPSGNTIEFGCGVGNGTVHLSKGRKVLSLDNNKGLIEKAKSRLNDAGIEHQIHECDFFNFSDSDKKLFREFRPKVIAGWFIGSHGQDIFKHTEEEPHPIVKSKLYREKIEDIIISSDVCVESVEYIHLAIRGELFKGLTEDVIFNSTKDDYDTYVFDRIGFEVIEVENFKWVQVNSEFLYGQAHNPNIAEGETVPMITSIVAKKK